MRTDIKTRRRAVTVAISVALLTTALGAQTASWLDRDPAGWNQPGAVPRAPAAGAETREALEKRCGSALLKGSPAAAALTQAGGVAFRHLDREIARDGIEVVGGMRAAGPGCEPQQYNLFVFVAGRFAGTLSPVAMSPNRDGEAGAARITGADAMTAEFARYKVGDPECCPSSRVRVTYRIDRTGAAPVVVPTEKRLLR